MGVFKVSYQGSPVLGLTSGSSYMGVFKVSNQGSPVLGLTSWSSYMGVFKVSYDSNQGGCLIWEYLR